MSSSTSYAQVVKTQEQKPHKEAKDERMSPEEIRKLWTEMDVRRMPRRWGTRCFDCMRELKTDNSYGLHLKTFPQSELPEKFFNICIICGDCYWSLHILAPPKTATEYVRLYRSNLRMYERIQHMTELKVKKETLERTNANLVGSIEDNRRQIADRAETLRVRNEEYVRLKIQIEAKWQEIAKLREMLSDLDVEVVKIKTSEMAESYKKLEEKRKKLEEDNGSLDALADVINEKKTDIEYQMLFLRTHWEREIRAMIQKNLPTKDFDKLSGDSIKKMSKAWKEELAHFLQTLDDEFQWIVVPHEEEEECRVCVNAFRVTRPRQVLGCGHSNHLCTGCWEEQTRRTSNVLDARNGLYPCPYCNKKLQKDGSLPF